MLAIPPAFAEDGIEMSVAVETEGFKITETDIGTLAIGEARTIETPSGQIVDILRTADGAEIYIDGELIDPGFGFEDGDRDVRIFRNHVQVDCDDESVECEKHIVIQSGSDGEVSAWTMDSDDGEFHEKTIEISCSDEDGATDCDAHVIRVGDGDVINIEKIHESHAGGEARTLIVIEAKEESPDD
jgi:hypothetical protein